MNEPSTIRAGDVDRGPRRAGFSWKPALYTAVVVACFSVGHFVGAAQKEQEQLKVKSVLAERFEVRDPTGELAASWGRGAKDQIQLDFFDKNQKSRLTVGLDEQGSPRIAFLDSRGASRMSLALSAAESEPSINLYNDQGQPTLTLGLSKTGGPGLSIGPPDLCRITVGVSKDGSPSIQVRDKHGKTRIALFIVNEEPVFALQDSAATMRATWRLLANGTPVLTFHDVDANPRLVFQTDAQGKPAIQFLDATGKVSRELK